MNQSTKEIVQPEQVLNSERKEQDKHVSPDIGNTNVIGSTVSLEDIINSKYSIDMRGSEYWVKKVIILREILRKACPDSKRPNWMPAYSFAPFYYVINGEWFEGTWERFPAVSPLDIDMVHAVMVLTTDVSLNQ